jgi:hypothetical protein
MWTSSLLQLLAGALAGFFALTAMIDLAGSRHIRAQLRQFGYPRRFYRAAGVLRLVTALLLAVPQLRIWGVVLAGLITFSWVVALLNHRQWRWAGAGALLMMSLAPASLTIH